MKNGFPHLLTVGLTVALCASAVPAFAHFPWLTVEDRYGAEPKLQCYFAESAAPDDPKLLKYVEGADVWQLSARGEPKAVELDKSEEELSRTVDPGNAESLFFLAHDLGVMTRHGSTFRLKYTALTGPDLKGWAWKSAKFPEAAGLIVRPERDGGEITVQVTFQGEPVVGAEVHFNSLLGDEIKRETNEKGLVAFKLDENEIESLRVKLVEQKSGEVGGDSFDEVRHYATVTFPPASHKPLATKVLPHDIPEHVTSFGAAVADGKLYFYGGHTGGAHDYYREGQSHTLWSLDLSGKGSWQRLVDGPHLQGNALVTHDGKLYRIGGFTAKNSEGEEQDLWSQSSFAAFDPASNKWTELPALPEPRSSFDAAVLGDHIYVIGGWGMSGDADSKWHRTAWKFDLTDADGEWTALPDAPFARRALSVAAFDGNIYAIGGMQEEGGPTTETAIYDTASKSWSAGPRLNGTSMTGFGSSAFSTGGRLYVSVYDGTLQRLSEDGSRWEVVGDLPTARFFHRMLPLDDDTLVFLGGANMGVGKFEKVETLDVAK
ncbi:Kelch repeat-containing protein [Stratiformator vulcanicus]|uniref:N-acetylneuraminate epimerase n=1 Tax=Stratiformator vulcanicus TaxID=2527980 RepID=A0A517R351_9PLAN|nr:hypothetical protein [Stratiformator vulcanicus]QDT38305.1 N-acetylneuraminate epimerase [Stratiformator vulcanicus]